MSKQNVIVCHSAVSGAVSDFYSASVTSGTDTNAVVLNGCNYTVEEVGVGQAPQEEGCMGQAACEGGKGGQALVEEGGPEDWPRKEGGQEAAEGRARNMAWRDTV